MQSHRKNKNKTNKHTNPQEICPRPPPPPNLLPGCLYLSVCLFLPDISTDWTLKIDCLFNLSVTSPLSFSVYECGISVPRFVDLVKSKTAKVTMYSDRAKGVLMENWPPNFEASFFNGGEFAIMASKL